MAVLQEQLLSVFSCFGPLYLLKVSSSAPPSPPGFSALIRFYSALQASRAQRHTDGQLLFQTSPLKVARPPPSSSGATGGPRAAPLSLPERLPALPHFPPRWLCTSGAEGPLERRQGQRPLLSLLP